MRRSWTWIVPALLMGGGMGLGRFGGPLDAQQKNVLVAKKVAAPPTLDGVMEDAWKSAPELEVTVRGGRNLPEGKTEMKLRSVYSGDTIYFLMQYKDATESLRRGPWVKQADGSWQKLKDPNDKGGDNNLYYEDKMAVIWNISSPAFEAKGCLSACHTGEGKPGGGRLGAGAGRPCPAGRSRAGGGRSGGVFWGAPAAANQRAPPAGGGRPRPRQWNDGGRRAPGHVAL